MTLGLSRVTCRLELHLKEVQTYLEEHPTPLVLSGQHMSGSWTAHLHKESKTQRYAHVQLNTDQICNSYLSFSKVCMRLFDLYRLQQKM